MTDMKNIIAIILVVIICSGCVTNTDENYIDNNSEISIFYNSPLLYQKPSRKSDSEIGKSLVSLINSATISIDFSLYGVSGQKEIVNALEDAISRGVKVRGVVDKDIFDKNFYKDTDKFIEDIRRVRTDYYIDIDSYKNQDPKNYNPFWEVPEGYKGYPQMVGYSLPNNQAIIAVHVSKSPSRFTGELMHNKFFVIDSKRVWTGSSNVSNAGTGGYNANIACVINNEYIAKLYEDEFSQMYTDNLYHKNKRSVEEAKRTILEDGTEIQLYFSPQDSTSKTAIIPLIENSKSSIRLPVFYITDMNITAALIDAYERGVDIKVILDASGALSSYTKHEILRAVGIEVKVENWGGKMHMKSMIVDNEYLVIGSMNFSSAGTNKNDENTLIIKSSKYALEVNEIFESLWESIPSEYAYKNPQPESYESINSMTDGIDNDFDKLVDYKDNGNPGDVELPSYQIVPKEDGWNLIKGIEDKNGHRLYILPNSEFYDMFMVNKVNEFYFPSVYEAKEAGFEPFDSDKHSDAIKE